MPRRLPALALLLGGFLVALPTTSALAAPPSGLPLQVTVAAPYLMSPSADGDHGRAFH